MKGSPITGLVALIIWQLGILYHIVAAQRGGFPGGGFPGGGFPGGGGGGDYGGGI